MSGAAVNKEDSRSGTGLSQ
ncbi:hypothetical protein RSAG8_07161, partial [Rhizoctonia solani AG-8 WAC10335]